jgi:hypothetical protein
VEDEVSTIEFWGDTFWCHQVDPDTLFRGMPVPMAATPLFEVNGRHKRSLEITFRVTVIISLFMCVVIGLNSALTIPNANLYWF